MSGSITFPTPTLQWGTLLQDPSAPLQTATKQYVDAKAGGAGYLPLTGGTLQGPGNLTVAGGAAAPVSIASGSIGVPAGQTLALQPSGGAITVGGQLVLAADPSVPLGAVTKQYADRLYLSIALSGCAGDGVTDDQPNIQAWLNTLTAGAVVLLQAGKWYYIHAAPLVIPPNVEIRGAASALDNQLASGKLFNGGGFVIDPTLPAGIIMGSATALKMLKVYRAGLTANASNAVADAAYTAWAAEAFYRQTNAVQTTSTVIPLANTSGITVGMAVSGPGTLQPSANPPTVTAVATNVSVTISRATSSLMPSGTYFRFGASTGIVVPYNTSGVILEELTLIGFRTGIQVFPGQYLFSKLRCDCITNIECTSGGDTAAVRDCEFLPLYGNVTSQAGRPGDAVFLHDGGLGVVFDNVFMFGWMTGWHLVNVIGGHIVHCGSECLDGAGTVNWRLESGSQIRLADCHGQAAATGFWITNTSLYELYNCSSAGMPSSQSNCIAHFLIDGTAGLGRIVAPSADAGYPGKVPFKITGTPSTCEIIEPTIFDMAGAAPTVPYIQGSLPNVTKPAVRQGVSYTNTTPGATVSGIWYSNGRMIDSTSNPLTTLTVALPPYPADKQLYKLWFNVAVTALTMTTTDGSAIGNFAANVTAGSLQDWIYVAAQNKWYCGAGAGAGAAPSSTTPTMDGVAAIGLLTNNYALPDHVHPTDTSRAPLASPTFTGTVTIPSGASISGYLPLTGGALSGSVSAVGVSTSAGFSCGSTLASGATDLTKQIALFGAGYGMSVIANTLNLVSNGSAVAQFTSSNETVNGTINSAGTNYIQAGTGTGNALRITPAASGSPVTLGVVSGGDANVNLNITSVGTSSQINFNIGGTGVVQMVSGQLTSVGTAVIQAGNAIGTNNVIRIIPTASGADPTIALSGPDNPRNLVIATIGTGLIQFNGGGIRVGSSAGPTWTQGAGAPSSTQPVGSLYSNTSGAAGARLYVSAGGGTWTAISGV